MWYRTRPLSIITVAVNNPKWRRRRVSDDDSNAFDRRPVGFDVTERVVDEVGSFVAGGLFQ